MSHREQLFLFWAAIWLMICYVASRKFRQSLEPRDSWDAPNERHGQWSV